MSNKPDSQPAYFLSLEVENVRCFGPRQTLDVSDGNGRPAQWTVILGDNGVGKTTLLQCLAKMEPTVGKTWFKGEEKQVPARLPRLYFEAQSMTKYAVPMRRHNENEILLSVTNSFGSKLKDSSPGNIAQGNLNIEYEEDEAIDFGFDPNPLLGFDALENLICYGYGASRRMRESTPVTEKEEDIGNWDTLFNEDTALGNAEEWLLKTQLNAKSSTPEVASKFEQQFDEVIKILKSILPDIQDIRIPQLTSVKEHARVEFQTPYGWVSVRSLGIGHRTMIAWVVDLARRLFERYPDSPDPLAEPAVVLVDEIDLHLHPKWQRQIITYLSERFPNTQFIVTAHSPLIVQAAVSVKANIVVLKREGDHVVIEQNIEAVRGWRVDQILTSDLFELESARPPDWDQLFARREALLSRSSLSESELAELKTIRQKISELPTGETVQEMEAMDLIRRATQELKQRGVQPK